MTLCGDHSIFWGPDFVHAQVPLPPVRLVWTDLLLVYAPVSEDTGEAWERAFYEACAVLDKVAEAPWSVAEWAVAPRFDIPRATALVLLLV